MAEARKKMARILTECEELLAGNEEPLHQYIKQNPASLPNALPHVVKIAIG